MAMTVTLAQNAYGKSGVRLVRVDRRGDLHDLKDVTVDVQLQGEFAPAYIDGDNTMVLPTDTMKNTVYAFAAERAIGDIERFGISLSEHFLGSTPDVRTVRITITEQLWSRIVVGGKPHNHSFTREECGKRTATVTRSSDEVSVEAGIRDLVVLKTTNSGFEEFLVDKFTTLRETSDRIFASMINANWRYSTPDVEFGLRWRGVRKALLDTFADHESRSVQHTLYAMGQAALEICDEILEIRLSMPNKHHLLVDLEPFGVPNPNEVFVATDEPFGLIEGTVRRK
jgi:urate oxidase